MLSFEMSKIIKKYLAPPIFIVHTNNYVFIYSKLFSYETFTQSCVRFM